MGFRVPALLASEGLSCEIGIGAGIGGGSCRLWVVTLPRVGVECRGGSAPGVRPLRLATGLAERPWPAASGSPEMAGRDVAHSKQGS